MCSSNALQSLLVETNERFAMRTMMLNAGLSPIEDNSNFLVRDGFVSHNALLSELEHATFPEFYLNYIPHSMNAL